VSDTRLDLGLYFSLGAEK